jgi:hypothetical protein
MRMRFQMILRTGPTIEMQNLLSIPTLWHGVQPSGKASIALVLVYCAEGSSSWDASACCYGTLKDIGIFTVIEPIRKFVQVERQVLPADVVVRPNDALLSRLQNESRLFVCTFPCTYSPVA